MAVVFTWGSPSDHGGSIELWNDGIVVHTDCHDCVSSAWSDRPQIVALYDALRDWLIDHPETVVPPVKDVPHDE
jgi:hypothetical protein